MSILAFTNLWLKHFFANKWHHKLGEWLWVEYVFGSATEPLAMRMGKGHLVEVGQRDETRAILHKHDETMAFQSQRAQYVVALLNIRWSS